MLVRRSLAVSLTTAALLVTSRASAWQEAHQIGDDVNVHVDPNGVAQVEHRLRWHVLRGPLKSIDLVHVEGAATVDPDVPIAAEDGRALLAHAARRDDRTVRITIDEPRALMRGNFTFDVRWRVDLATSRALVRDGSSWRLTWSAPVATDGFDAAQTHFELPAAPDPPQPIVAETGAVDDAVVSKLTRQPDHDALDLVRPHVARGEAPVWTLRVDLRALPGVADSRLRPSIETRPPPEPDRIRDVAFAAFLAAVALALAWAVHKKSRRFDALCVARGATPRPLLPLSSRVRALLAGLSFGSGIGLELRGWITAGAASVAVAALACALRAPEVRARMRGPGRWLALKPADAFAAPARPVGAMCAGLGCALMVVALAWASRHVDADAPWLVALDSLALVPLLLTGRRAQLPPNLAVASSSCLRRVFRSLRGCAALRVSPWARLPVNGHDPDELRLLVLPRASMPGVLGIEVGVAWSSTPAGWAGAPEVLARVLDGSAAAVKLIQDLPRSRIVTGRRPDERVLRLVPEAPTAKAAAALVRALGGSLTDRRVAAEEWAGDERRVRRPPRAPSESGASSAA